ncbi:Enteropeptidase [Trichinella pseudospiralis]|uniref:Enteropeptidase n=1 Tax=Trichinella pseudospiralis TaxID=6337 RepID=A0A0V0YLX0_TRIPS|nr:Enteropeptidase [Trichinella pseudospiralis]
MKRFHHFGIFFHYALLMFCIIIKKTFSEECGKPYFEPYLTNSKNSNEMDGEWVAKPYSFPWTVHIFAHVSGLWYESCVGSLISLYPKNASDTILTASRCVRVNKRFVDPNAITVTAGVFNIKKLEEPHRVTSKVLAYISDNFGDVSKPNDIALLRLKVEIPHSKYISPVCLPYQNQELPWGETCFVSGWGLTRESGKPSPKLRQVGIPILRNNNCPFIDVEDMFCAGEMSGGKDSCQGDSGGPLVCKLNDTFFQMGIVSFGDGCARKNHPGIYTKVPHYRQSFLIHLPLQRSKKKNLIIQMIFTILGDQSAIIFISPFLIAAMTCQTTKILKTNTIAGGWKVTKKKLAIGLHIQLTGIPKQIMTLFRQEKKANHHIHQKIGLTSMKNIQHIIIHNFVPHFHIQTGHQ